MPFSWWTCFLLTPHAPLFEIRGPHGALAKDLPQFYTVGIQVNRRKDIGMLSFLFISIFFDHPEEYLIVGSDSLESSLMRLSSLPVIYILSLSPIFSSFFSSPSFLSFILSRERATYTIKSFVRFTDCLQDCYRAGPWDIWSCLFMNLWLKSHPYTYILFKLGLDIAQMLLITSMRFDSTVYGVNLGDRFVTTKKTRASSSLLT